MSEMLGARARTVRRWLAVSACAGVLLAALVAPRAEAATVTRITYVASDAASGLIEPVIATETPIGYVAPLGYFRFTTTGRQFTVTVDDLGALAGDSVPVTVVGKGLRHDLCLRDGVPRTFGPVRRGTRVTVYVLTGPWRQQGYGCTLGGTAGTLTVVQ